MTKQSEITGDSTYVPLLDHGFVGLVDSMGSDAAIVQAARVSYGAGTKTVNSDRGLIRYLMRHGHSTPYEMANVKFHVRAPMFVARQWMRHRTASVNEESARYSEMSDEFYLPVPEMIQPQSQDNKQGRAGDLDPGDRLAVCDVMQRAYEYAQDAYQALLGHPVYRNGWYTAPCADDEDSSAGYFETGFPGVARELARAVMPVGAYTEWYWSVNLHNLFHFLRLRSDPHAQYEIRVYAEAIAGLIRPRFPLAVEAFEDYVRGAATLSRMDLDLTMALLHAGTPPRDTLETWYQECLSWGGVAQRFGMTGRELTEYRQRFNLD